MKTVKLHDKEFGPFISSDRIADKINYLGKEISKDYQGKKPLFIAILNGAFMFASDLLKKVEIDCEISFVKSSSYDGIESTGALTELIGLTEDIECRHVIVIEDIVDTGSSMHKTLATLDTKKPASVEICTLLFKPNALKYDINLKYVGFEIPNNFVVGYGLDYDGLGRNLPEILSLKDA